MSLPGRCVMLPECTARARARVATRGVTNDGIDRPPPRAHLARLLRTAKNRHGTPPVRVYGVWVYGEARMGDLTRWRRGP